ncbi:MAG TPA: AzlC family ABC transporter permease [Casimicrobiaceae bacterium]|nr:AzlC family ABC transporter permease [Casimicrobiaceae bacterium]
MRNVLASRDFREGFVEMLPACLGLLPFGIVCGVGAAAAGTGWLGSLGMSAIVFSGAAQIVAAQMLAAGAPFAVIVLTTSVLGLRLLMYSAAIAPFLKPLPEHWQRVLAFLLSDQVFAAAIRRFHIDEDREAAGRHFLGSGVALWLTWQVACMLGFFAGNLIPSAWSLEFAVPLCFIALVAPLFRNAPSILAAISAGVAVLALAGLPMRLNLIVAGLIGIAVGTIADLAGERWKPR